MHLRALPHFETQAHGGSSLTRALKTPSATPPHGSAPLGALIMGASYLPGFVASLASRFKQ